MLDALHVTTFEIMHGAPKDPAYGNQRTCSRHFFVRFVGAVLLLSENFMRFVIFDDTDHDRSHLLVFYLLSKTFAVFVFVPIRIIKRYHLPFQIISTQEEDATIKQIKNIYKQVG